MDKIYRRPTQSNGTPKKKKDEKARKRNVIMNFRVSPQEKELIDNRIALSGLSKSEFFIQSCMYQKILVKGNVRTYDEMRKQLAAIKKHLSEVEHEFLFYDCVERLAGDLIMEKHKVNKNVCANVDFYSGFIYTMLGIPEELFTPIFAMARIPGWCAHRLEELLNGNKIIRPAYKYVGQHVDEYQL